MLDDGRVATVVRPMDRALELFKLIGVPLVAVSLSLPAIDALTVPESAGWKDLLIGSIGPLLAVAYLGLLQLDSVNSRVDRLLARVRRQVAVNCNHEYAADHGGGGIACRLTPNVFQAPVFDYQRQRKVVAELSGACGEEQRGQYWFIEGSSGTGKTRTALLLVQRLVRDPQLFELGSRCYLYDFSYSEGIQEELERHLGSSRHEDAVVLIDNFQLVTPGLLRQLTRRLIDDPGSGGERMVVFLAREAGAWNLSPGRDVRLLSEAKVAKRHCLLEGPRSSDVAREVSEFDGDPARLIRRLQKPGLASAAQLHLGQVIARNRSVPPEVVDVVDLLVGEDAADPRNTRMLGLLAALSMHRGTFSRRSLWRAIRVATAAEPAGGPSIVAAARMWLVFRRFQKIGLVPKIHLDSTRFIFHEDIARQCIDGLWDDPTFWVTFLAVGQARLARQDSDEDALRGWLIAVEIGDQEALEARFDGALLHGAYQRMAQCLQRSQKRYELKPSSLLQLAILLDRTGDFVGSRELFSSGLDDQLDSSSDLVVLLCSSRIEARHQDEYEDDLKALVGHLDPFVAIVGEYWQVHIDAHFGIFEPDRLLRLGTEALKLMDDRESHWRLYSLARIYFDSLRQLYLCGEPDAAAFTTPEHQALDDYLRGRLPTYEALHVLYTQAHLVGHVFLPRVALFGEEITPDDMAIADVEPADVESVDALVATSQRLYKRARDEFWLYGDREERYLMAESLNAQMIEAEANLDALDGPLDEYEDFIVAGERNMLASFPHFYRLRREVLRYYEVLLSPETFDSIMADTHLGEAELHLTRIFELDREIGNAYGLLRAEMLQLLLRGAREGAQLPDDEMVALERRMEEHGYEFEQRLLCHLVSRDKLTPAELRAVFQFYPFVNQ